MPVFERSSLIPCSADALFGYHAAPGAFGRLSPPFNKAVVVKPLRALENGERAVIDVSLFGPVSSRWVARHDDVVAGRGFVDVMEQGPFRSWRHEHIFEPIDETSCRLVDRITYEAPVFGLSDVVVRTMLEPMFRYRHTTTQLDAALLSQTKTQKRLRVGITGASGLIGSELSSLLSVLGHTAVPFVRRGDVVGAVRWNTDDGSVSDDASGLDAVVHLAGENIAAGRLDDEKKARLRLGRVTQTTKLLDALAKLPQPPKVVVAASAVGIYGDRGSDVVDEDSAAAVSGEANFLSDLCHAWEGAVLGHTSSSSTWRAVALRIGIVQSLRGGALQRLAPVFSTGGGAILGDGRAFTTPISVDDLAAIVVAALGDDRLRGAVNAVPAEAVTQTTYSKTLGAVLHRPVLLHLPRAVLRLGFGEFGERMLDSQRVRPSRLLAVEHRFRHADLAAALRHQLGR